MAKKVRNKNRSFKVHSDFNGIPFIRFGGKYLSRELGLVHGDRLEMTRHDDQIILRKFSPAEVAEYETARQTSQAKALLKSLFSTNQKAQMMVAESRSTYSVDDEVARYLQA